MSIEEIKNLLTFVTELVSILKISKMNNPIILYIMITSFITTNSFSQKTIGSIDRIERNKFLIDKNTKIEVLADGFDWSEGPVWSNELNGLLFSDVPQNKIYFEEKDGVTEFISPSGYTGVSITSGREIGSNGLNFYSMVIYF